MKHLFKIGISDCIGSFAPILFWMLAGKLYGQEYSTGFILSYPMQFVYGLLFTILITGGSKLELKEKNGTNYSNAGWLCFTLLVTIPALIVAMASMLYYGTHIHHNWLMSVFGTYLLGVDWIVYADVKRLQYVGKETKSAMLTTLWGAWRLFTLFLMGVFVPVQVFIIVCPILTTVSALVVCIRYRNFHEMKLPIKQFMKYSSSDIAHNIGMAIIYFLGVGVIQRDEMSLIAYNALSLCTDTQWDMLGSIDTYVTTEALKPEWLKRKSMVWKTVCLYSGVLLASSIALTVCYSGFLPAESLGILTIIFIIEMSLYIPDAMAAGLTAYVQIQNPTPLLFITSFACMLVRLIVQCISPSVYSVSWACFVACALGTLNSLTLYSRCTRKERSYDK